jgi:hypothetical protein
MIISVGPKWITWSTLNMHNEPRRTRVLRSGWDGPYFLKVDCITCDELFAGGEAPQADCPSESAPHGHHCNHSWTHDSCCYCETQWGEGGEVLGL